MVTHNYLLDTHVLLWWFSDDERLPERERKRIADPGHIVAVSVASTWEMVIKKSIGKLRYPDNLKQVLDESGFDLLSIELDHVLELESLSEHHRDPFDRLLISQARSEEFTLITGDPKIWDYDVPVCKLE